MKCRPEDDVYQRPLTLRGSTDRMLSMTPFGSCIPLRAPISSPLERIERHITCSSSNCEYYASCSCEYPRLQSYPSASIPNVVSGSATPAPRLAGLNQGLANWAESAHAELQDRVDLAFTSRRWQKINCRKLFWRVDEPLSQ